MLDTLWTQKRGYLTTFTHIYLHLSSKLNNIDYIHYLNLNVVAWTIHEPLDKDPMISQTKHHRDPDRASLVLLPQLSCWDRTWGIYHNAVVRSMRTGRKGEKLQENSQRADILHIGLIQ